ncbi:MAG: hypothetical protein J6T10_17025 [Methanobrevibacter sp.]|nr:hypothetical protein [Methanobrevibacter sp.]
MKIRLYDCYSDAEKLDVGDVFRGINSDCASDRFDLENIDIKLSGVRLKGFNKSSGCSEFSWNLTCQSVFIIIDLSTNKVIFTSKKYKQNERYNSSCKFYKELQDFIDSGFTVDKGLYKIEDDVFEDI